MGGFSDVVSYPACGMFGLSCIVLRAVGSTVAMWLGQDKIEQAILRNGSGCPWFQELARS
eukprot:4316327-Ditylum_brightwellii.AAC.1